jgi:hypothetical protein
LTASSTGRTRKAAFENKPPRKFYTVVDPLARFGRAEVKELQLVAQTDGKLLVTTRRSHAHCNGYVGAASGGVCDGERTE